MLEADPDEPELPLLLEDGLDHVPWPLLVEVEPAARDGLELLAEELVNPELPLFVDVEGEEVKPLGRLAVAEPPVQLPLPLGLLFVPED